MQNLVALLSMYVFLGYGTDLGCGDKLYFLLYCMTANKMHYLLMPVRLLSLSCIAHRLFTTESFSYSLIVQHPSQQDFDFTRKIFFKIHGNNSNMEHITP